MRSPYVAYNARVASSSAAGFRKRLFCQWCLRSVLLLAAACRTSHIPPVPPSAAGAAQPLQIQLPESLESQRSAFRRRIGAGIETVATFFQSSGVSVASESLVDSAIVFEGVMPAREYLAREYQVPPSSIPDTFAGTVVGTRLFLVSPDSYRATWRALYPNWPWTDRTYDQLIVHELAHRAHEVIAVSLGGSPESMGPAWFFEGLAVSCAGQFDDKQPPMTRAEIELHVGSGRTPSVSYPLYGRLVRSLASCFSMKALLLGASDPGFPGVLWPAEPPPTPHCH